MHSGCITAHDHITINGQFYPEGNISSKNECKLKGYPCFTGKQRTNKSRKTGGKNKVKAVEHLLS